MRSRVDLLVAAFFLVSSAAPQAPILWQNLTVGMTKDQVKALYPDGTVNLTPECKAKVVGDYGKGGLQSVVVRFGDLYAAGKSSWNSALLCQKIVRASIIEKYGEPDATGRHEISGLNKGDKYEWLKGSLYISFYAQDGRPWTVIQYRYIASKEVGV